MQRNTSVKIYFAVAAALSSTAWAQTPFVTNASLPGTPFDPGVRGQAIPAVTINRGEYVTGVPDALEVSHGSSLRGVAGGLEADTFNWKTRNNSARAGTLDYLRHSRDHDANLYITANVRGLVEPDPTTPGNQRFYDTSIPTLASLAGDWVRYTNRIVQTYRQGQTITDARDAAILNSLTWSSSTPGDNFDKLLAVGEAAVPKVKYWEIGNEPRVGLLSTYKVTNSYTFFAPPRAPDDTHKTDFRERYAALTSAMRAEDPTIKVGPALQWLSAVTEREIVDSILRQQPDGSYLPVDFLAYHPYQKLNEQTTVAARESYLRGVYDDHLSKVNGIRNVISAAGRDPNSIELVASEHNVSNWSSNDTTAEMNMAHALGNTETVFSFARLGIKDAHYWIWPAHRWDGTKYPMFLAAEKLRDHMGDTLLSVSADNSDNLHLYTTRESETKGVALWGLNFDNDTAITRDTPIQNLGGRGKVTLWTLGALAGTTSLDSSNFSSEIGGPSNAVGWKSVDMTGQRLDNLRLTFGSATLTLLQIDAWRQMALPGDVNVDGKVDTTDANLVNVSLNQNEKNWWQGDVTGDGVVNSADAAIVSANTGVQTGNRWKVQSASWTSSSSWTSSPVPNAVGASAYFADSITTNRTVTANSAVTVGTLVYDSPFTYNVVGTGSLKLQASGSTSARAYVIQGDQKITVPLSLASSSIIDVAGGASLRADGSVSIAAGKTLTKSGPGTLTLAAAQSHASGSLISVAGGTLELSKLMPTTGVTITGGTLAVLESAPGLSAGHPSGSNASVSRPASLAISHNGAPPGSRVYSGVLDLANNDLILDYATASPLSDVRDMLRAGALVSSTAQGGGPSVFALGYADNVDLGLPTFDGQAVDATTVLVKFTWTGDLNLDGFIDFQDLSVFNTKYDHGTSSGRLWTEGDFNYDGRIDFQDLSLFNTNYDPNKPSLPEPAGVAGIFGIIVMCTRRRRRKLA